MKKWIKYGLLATLVIVLLGGVALIVCLDGIIKAATTEGLAFATKCDSKLDKASFSPLSGHLKLSGLEVKNPKEFDQSHAFVQFVTSEVEVKPMSLVSDKIEIPVINLDGLELSYVKPIDGKDNVQVILDNVNRLVPQGDPNAPQAQPAEKSPSNKEIHVGIVRFTNAKIHATVTVGALPVKVDVPMPNFEVTNLNVKGGMPALTAELVKDIGVQIVKQAPEIGRQALESAKGNLKNIGADVKNVENAAKGIGDLFKKK